MYSSTLTVIAISSIVTLSSAQIQANAPGCLQRCYAQKLNEINNPGLAPGINPTNTAALCAVANFTKVRFLFQ